MLGVILNEGNVKLMHSNILSFTANTALISETLQVLHCKQERTTIILKGGGGGGGIS